MTMKRIAVIFEGNINNRLGVFAAVLNRVKHLRRIAPYDIDLHMLQVYDGTVMSKLRGCKHQADRPTTIEVDGETLHMHWFKRSWTDALGHRLLGRRPPHLSHWLDTLAHGMNGYDLFSAHDRMGGIVAQRAAALYHKPHFITWHGSSIHTDPLHDPLLKAVTSELLHRADRNFFVSHGLHEKALLLTTGFPADVLFNGASKAFTRFPDDERTQLRNHFGVENTKVVTFAGRFEPVKNVTLLPRIFTEIARKYGKPVTFWTIGSGKQHHEVEQALAQQHISCKMWGMQPLEMMPRLMNCTDVLVLPSLLEGLPLVTLEALQCGANVVATNVGGTAEGIGRENAIDLDDSFLDNFTNRAVEMLEGRVQQSLPQHMSWEATARKENEIYKESMQLADAHSTSNNKF